MPEPLIALPAGALLRGAAIGFCGKLPARGDFVAAGLPRRFSEPWLDWMQRLLASGRRALGDAWEGAWNEAPIWRFALSAGVCGPDAALGLWMPSVDSIGRHFPLTFAAIAADADAHALLREGAGFLEVAEQLGLEALARDIAPDEIAGRLAAETWTEPTPIVVPPEAWCGTGSVWWTDGAPRVPARCFHANPLPDEASFAGMLQADTPLTKNGDEAPEP
jgi:type VI secretion system protein ImpM